MARDYLAEARAAIEVEEARRIENLIADRATQMRLKDEREAQLAALHKRHGLDPAVTTPRMLADAEIAYANGWRSFVSNRFAGSAKTMHVLDPENSGHKDRAAIDELLTLRDKLRAQFEASWPPADLLERIGATDGVAAHYGHSARAA